MVSLPASIENALREAGFSPTEILILNHLLAEEGMTLRGLAAKTGKSTGVLDQAMKKLLRRRVVERQMVNDAPKYVVQSLQSIVDWMEQDTQKRREEIDRRYSNFESFILTLERERSRPHVEHFEGFEGIKKAYDKLLEYDSKDLCAYIPVAFKEEEDPLRDFKVQWFRDRYRKGVFLRVLAHDSALGKRFMSRDAFEYRKTLLLNPERYPFNFEKYVINGTVACIDYDKRSATFLHYPEMARSEHDMFERLWQKKLLPKKAGDAQESEEEATPAPAVRPVTSLYVPAATRLTSLIREFFVSPKSWMAIGFCAVLSASLSFTIYNTSVRVNTERIRERVTAIASTATVEFTANELNALRTMKDVETLTYKNVVHKLQQIRRRNQDIMYVYLLRPSETGTLFEFIADADAEHPDKVVDTNNDGKITSADDLGFPGVAYDVSYVEVLKNREYEAPIATREAYTDKWGTFFTGYAPIRDTNGKTIALLAVDMTNQDLNRFNQQAVRPLMYFIVLFFLFVLVRFSALNRSVLSNIFQNWDTRRTTLLLFFATLFTAAFGTLFYVSSLKSAEKIISEKAKTIAATAAPQLDHSDIAEVWTKEDVKKEEYIRLVYLLQEIRRNNPDVKFAYIMRKTNDPREFSFVADADSLEPGVATDFDADGKISESDQKNYPGEIYLDDEKPIIPAIEGFSKPTGFPPTTDQWGTVISGWAPIYNEKKEAIAIVGIDITANKVYENLGSAYTFLWYFSGFFVILLLMRLVVFHPILFKEIAQFFKLSFVIRVVVYGLLIILICSTFLFVYTLYLVQDEAGKRLMSIATTAASQFDINDLNQLHQAKDMETEVYQRVYNKLLYIRDNNPGVRYAYIMRPTETEGIWEFVADADTNYFFPSDWDFDQSGTIDEADENVYPGYRYDASSGIPNYKIALEQPIFVIARDQWGQFISGHAPIKNEQGQTIAVIGIDSFLKDVNFVALKKIMGLN